jgi:hypothetical protein
MALLGRFRHLRYFRFGWERTFSHNRMPDECKIGIEVNPKGRAGKTDYTWHQPLSGESALGRLTSPPTSLSCQGYWASPQVTCQKVC